MLASTSILLGSLSQLPPLLPTPCGPRPTPTKCIKSGLVREDDHPDAGDLDDDEDEEDNREEEQDGAGATAGAKCKNTLGKSSGSGKKGTY
jgi:hypothetical protein